MNSLTIPIAWSATGPAICVAAGAMLALVVDLAVGRRQWWPTWLTMAAGVVLAGEELLRSLGPDRSAFTLPFQLSAIILVATFAALIVASVMAREQAMPAGEFHFLLGSAAAGGLVMVSAHDFVTLLVGIELLALPSIALVGLRQGDRRAISAAWTFFLTSVVSTAIALMGFALLYGLTGTLEFDLIADFAAFEPAADVPLTVALLLTLIGLLFKLGAVPFHAWVPDSYRSATPAVTLFLSTVSKAASIGALAVVLGSAFAAWRPAWVPVVAVVAAVSMTLGNLGALRQRDGIALLAWSSIAHAGFLLAPLGAMEPMSATPLVEYLAIYVIANLVAFGAMAVVSATRGSIGYASLRGLVRTDPWLGVPLVMALLTLAGFPPAVIGLLAKYVVFAAVVAHGPLWLAVVMALNVMIGLAYYLRLIAVLCEAPTELAPAARGGAAVARVAVAAMGVALVVFSAWPAFLLDHVAVVLRLAG